MEDDAAAVRVVLTASDEPTVVVAHSYGGIVTAQAAADVDAVRHLVFVSSYLPEVGQSLSSFGGEEPAPFLDVDPDAGTFTVHSEALAETFLQDCGPEIQQLAMDKTALQSLWRSWSSRCGRPASAADPHHVPALRSGSRHPCRTAASSSPKGRTTSSTSTPAARPFLSQPTAVRDLILGL